MAFSRRKLHRTPRVHKPAKVHHKVLKKHAPVVHHAKKAVHHTTAHTAKHKPVSADHGHKLHHRGVGHRHH